MIKYALRLGGLREGQAIWWQKQTPNWAKLATQANNQLTFQHPQTAARLQLLAEEGPDVL